MFMRRKKSTGKSIEYSIQKLNQQIMGMKIQNYRIGWALTYYIKVQFILIFIFLTFLLTNLISISETLVIMVAYQLFLIASVNQTLLISTFFHHGELAGELGSFLLFLESIFYFAIFLVEERSLLLYFFICLFPHSAFSLILMRYLTNSAVFLKEEFSPYFGLTMLVIFCFMIFQQLISIPIYFILYIYLEEIQPGVDGTSKSWLYFLEKITSNRPNSQYQELQTYQPLEDLPYRGLNQHRSKCAIQIDNINKFYEQNHALQDLTLSIYEGQIFCLLGHNGAGKTTTISILTGLIQKSSGKILIQGLNIDEDFEIIQQRIGICNQQDVLYGELTVRESLEYQGRLRGMKKLKQEVSNVIQQIGLQQYKNTITSQLSGGNKRKLSLGIAIMANSQIIFLDEPSSAMDPMSRQQLWEIIKDLKQQNKTIILTTHFLEEAEVLADKIAILKQGKMMVLGTSKSIKDQFAVGYTLNINGELQNFDQIKHTLDQIGLSYSIKEKGQGWIALLLPFDQDKLVQQFLSEIESSGQYQLSITKNTLEDAYLKLNKEEDVNVNSSSIIEIQNYKMIISTSRYQCLYLQMKAMMLRKMLTTIRNFSVMLMILFPLGFILASVIIGAHYLEYIKDTQLKVFFIALFLVQSFTLNSSTYIYLPLYERDTKIRQQLRQMGLSDVIYWTGTFLVDQIIMIISTVLIYCFLSLGYLPFFDPYALPTFKLFLAFNGYFLTFCYLNSFAYSDAKSAFRQFPIINFFLFYTIPLIISDFLIKDEYFKVMVSFVSPFFALDQGMKKIQASEDYSFYSNLMIAETVLMMILVLILERKLVTFSNRQPLNNDQLSLSVNHVKHNYGDKRVLNDISLDLKKQSILSLLGPNGAGKTTLITLISDIQKQQSGSINYTQWNRISACQQQEGLWEELQAEETLRIYSWIKCGCGRVQGEIDGLLSTLQIRGKIKDMSGGQKRKMSIAIALLGQDDIVILDEPSAGLDPFAKRRLWRLIKEHVERHASSILLTTHDMQEAAVLSDQIAIMINGSVVQNNTTAGLLEQFGHGYEVRVRTQAVPEALATMRDRLGQIHLVGEQGQLASSGEIVAMVEEATLSRIFDVFGVLKQNKLADECTLSQANLESVFVYFAKFQI